MPKLFPPGYQFLDANGDPVNSGTVNFYDNGTTTDKGIFTDASLATAATNAALLNSAGRFNQGDLYGSGTYTVVLKDSASTQIWSRDDFTVYQFNGQGSDIASATALDVNIEGTFHDVTGTTTITSFTTFGIGQIKVLQFDGALTLTHNATDLILPSGENITTTAGDIGFFYEYASTDWRCVFYSKRNGLSIAVGGKVGADVASATDLAVDIEGSFFDVTGTTTITTMKTKGIGSLIILQFDGALTLTHNATDLILPGAANIITAAGDIATFYEYATGDWRCTNYQPNDTVLVPGGISFPATQDASSGVNVLDDYEEGTWTPDLSDGTQTDATQTTEVGTYTKIGRTVFWTFNLVISSLGAVNGSLRINGLPFTSAATFVYSGCAGNATNLAITAGENVTGVINASSTNIRLQLWDATIGATTFQSGELSADGAINLSGFYEV